MREFDSFATFGRHLEKLALEGELVTDLATKKAAAIVLDDAQARIGVYQDSAGPFPAWAPLAESTTQDRISKGFSPFEPLLRTGGLRDSYATSQDGHEAVIGSDSDIAVYQEVGTPTIPPRPVLGPAAFEAKPRIGAITAAIMVAWLCGERWRAVQSIKLP